MEKVQVLVQTRVMSQLVGRLPWLWVARWIVDLEGVFRTSPYPIGAKVWFALDLLHHATRSCWEFISKSIMLTELETTSWEEFVTQLRVEVAWAIIV